MNRRSFLSGMATVASAAATHQSPMASALTTQAGAEKPNLNIRRHRFGVNYTPSRNWWFCWNDWDPGSIQRDLDAIASLGADHLRLLLIWPYFQPNLTWVSPLHLDRLDQMLTFMGQRNLDALITVFTGQLSGWFFLPPFIREEGGFFQGKEIWNAQELFIRQLSTVVQRHNNVIGFDLGNEINTCWTAPTGVGDAWMKRIFALMDSAAPGHLNINGIDEQPWFETTTFSPAALIEDQQMPVMHCYPYWSGALQYGGPMDPPSVRLLAGMAALIRSYAGTQQKPVWAGEFNTCIETLDEKQQAEWLERAVLAAIDAGVSWFSYWDSHDVDRRFAFNSLEYSLGLLTNDGRVKQQGNMFRRLAEAHRGKLVRFPTAPLPPPPANPTHDRTWAWLLDWMGWRPRRSTAS